MQHAYEMVCYSIFAAGVLGWIGWGVCLMVGGVSKWFKHGKVTSL